MKTVLILLMISTNAFAGGRPTDDQVIAIVEKTEAVTALKMAYGNCAQSGTVKTPHSGNLIGYQISYVCEGLKDGRIQITASLDIASWGEASPITLTVSDIGNELIQ